jgi:hypothetical protein
MDELLRIVERMNDLIGRLDNRVSDLEQHNRDLLYVLDTLDERISRLDSRLRYMEDEAL